MHTAHRLTHTEYIHIHSSTHSVLFHLQSRIFCLTGAAFLKGTRRNASGMSDLSWNFYLHTNTHTRNNQTSYKTSLTYSIFSDINIRQSLTCFISVERFGFQSLLMHLASAGKIPDIRDNTVSSEGQRQSLKHHTGAQPEQKTHQRWKWLGMKPVRTLTFCHSRQNSVPFTIIKACYTEDAQ